MKPIKLPMLNKWMLGLLGCGLLAASAVPGLAQGSIISIVNAGFEDPVMPNISSSTFNGVGFGVPVPGWDSNDPGWGGAIHWDEQYPGRTGNNVLYLHGIPEQNFYTKGFDLGVDLQSHSTYTFSVDVLSWWHETGSAITQGYTTFRIGVYTGPDYENRNALTEWAGNFNLLDEGNQLLPSVTLVLTFSTGDVAPGTKFWIGGDRYGSGGSGTEPHIPQFDNFQLSVVSVPEPSTVALILFTACGVIGLRGRTKRRGSSL